MKLSTSYIKLILIIVHDILISIIAWFFAFLLRFDFQISDEYRSSIIDFLPLIIILHGFIFIKLSIHRHNNFYKVTHMIIAPPNYN